MEDVGRLWKLKEKSLYSSQSFAGARIVHLYDCVAFWLFRFQQTRQVETWTCKIRTTFDNLNGENRKVNVPYLWIIRE